MPIKTGGLSYVRKYFYTQCNEFAIANNMRELCDIYDVFGLEQDAMIIYYIIVQHWIEKIQQA